MNKEEVICELAYMYGINKDKIKSFEEFEDFFNEIDLHAKNIIEVWFKKYEDTSPLQTTHDYFNQEILGK